MDRLCCAMRQPSHVVMLTHDRDGGGGGGSAAGAPDSNTTRPVGTYVVPQSRKCSGMLLFHNTHASNQSLLGSMRSVLMNRFTKYFAVLKHSAIQFFDSQEDFAANGRPADVFVLRDGHICKKITKRLFDGTIEYKIMVVHQKSNGSVATLAELVAPPCHGPDHINTWFSVMLRVLTALRMIRLERGARLPIPKMECHGWLTKKAIANFGANRRRFFVGHLNLLCYYVDDKSSAGPIRVLEIDPRAVVKIEDHDRMEFSVSFPDGHPRLVLQAGNSADLSRWLNFLHLAHMWASHRQSYQHLARRLRTGAGGTGGGRDGGGTGSGGTAGGDDDDHENQRADLWEIACRYWTTHVLTQCKHLAADAAAGIPHAMRPTVWAALSGAHNWYTRRLHDPLRHPARSAGLGAGGGGGASRRRMGSHASPPAKPKIALGGAGGGRSGVGGASPGRAFLGGGKLAANATALSMQALLLKYSMVVKEDRIERDLDRTFPMVEYFASAPSEDPAGGQEMLKKLLRAYAAYDDEVQYCQGMNWIAGLILCAWAPAGRLVEIPYEEPEAPEGEGQCSDCGDTNGQLFGGAECGDALDDDDDDGLGGGGGGNSGGEEGEAGGGDDLGDDPLHRTPHKQAVLRMTTMSTAGVSASANVGDFTPVALAQADAACRGDDEDGWDDDDGSGSGNGGGRGDDGVGGTETAAAEVNIALMGHYFRSDDEEDDDDEEHEDGAAGADDGHAENPHGDDTSLGGRADGDDGGGGDGDGDSDSDGDGDGVGDYDDDGDDGLDSGVGHDTDDGSGGGGTGGAAREDGCGDDASKDVAEAQEVRPGTVAVVAASTVGRRSPPPRPPPTGEVDAETAAAAEGATAAAPAGTQEGPGHIGGGDAAAVVVDDGLDSLAVVETVRTSTLDAHDLGALVRELVREEDDAGLVAAGEAGAGATASAATAPAGGRGVGVGSAAAAVVAVVDEGRGGGEGRGGDGDAAAGADASASDCSFVLDDTTFDASGVQLAAAERAFWIFVTLMERPCFALRAMFLHGMQKLDSLLTKFDAIFKRCLPHLHAHVDRMKREAKIPAEVSTPRMYAMDWFMTLFSRMNLGLGIRVLDAFVVESWGIVFKIGITLMRMLHEELMAIDDFGSFTRVFREDVVERVADGRIGVDTLMEVASRESLS